LKSLHAHLAEPSQPRALGSGILLLRRAAILATIALAGCAGTTFDAGRTETALPLNRAWVDGHMVQYVTTDISDPTMAKALGVNLVPRLADAIAAPPGHSVLERVYKFPNDEQASVFQSAPLPAGAENADRSYSPLWRMVLVRWAKASKVRVLRSEEELLAAADKGDVTLEVTSIVVNCPVTRGANGRALRGVR